MTNAVQDILRQAESLTVDEREELLLELANAVCGLKTAEETLTPELKAELDRRIADFEANPENAAPAESVFAELRQKYGHRPE